MGKKKRAVSEAEAERVENDKAEIEPGLVNGDSPEKKKKKKKKERNEREKEESEAIEIPTVSVAVPGSIINNAQSLELATRVLLSYLCTLYLALL